MKIAVDAMGGDNAPGEIVKGAVDAAQSGYGEILLVGDRKLIEKELTKYPKVGQISIIHASEMIAMDEAPALAVRKKKDSSIAVATRLVKDDVAQGVVSAGSTGAQMTSSIMYLGRIKGIKRPAIATLMPTLAGPKVILDIGANTDSTPENLLQFAYMGSLYAEKILDFKVPSVALINIGTEKTKGNQLIQQAYELLAESKLNFIGNIETRDITAGIADVLICDGFLGNSLIKFAEGIASTFEQMLKKELSKNAFRKIGALTLLPSLKGFKKAFDYSEYGGAPLLGVNGVSIVSHGSSKATAIRNAIKVAAQCNQTGLVNAISLVEEKQ
jgi:glycerol-3-phosphate acyltransferase PlsX